MKVRVQSNWSVYGHTSINVDEWVEVLEDRGDEVSIEFQDYRNEYCYAAVPESVLDMREYRMSQEE